MKKSRVVLHIVPGDRWKISDKPETDIVPFVKDALSIERRLKKGANLKNERMRYTLCCKRIQEGILALPPTVEKEELGDSYLGILRAVYEEKPEEASRARAAACFFPPEKMADHLELFGKLMESSGYRDSEDIKKRLSFFKSALNQGAGVIEIVDFPAEATSAPPPPSEIKPVTGRAAQPYAADDELTEKERAGLLDILNSAIEKAIRQGSPVNFSNQPHSVITEALNGFVYKRSSGERQASVRVMYLDGSESEPFPLLCLERPVISAMVAEQEPIKAALISMRHLEMDEKVHFAWFRNRKVSVSRPFAETDVYCTRRSMELFDAHKDQPLCLHLFQTGLETAVVGFYRALVRVLQENRERAGNTPCCVVPFYYDGREKIYRQGTVWA